MSADDTLVSENEQSKGMGEELNRVEGWAFFACYILLFGGVSKFRPTVAVPEPDRGTREGLGGMG